MTAETERAAAVKWLRELARVSTRKRRLITKASWWDVKAIADAIERGAHIAKEEGE